jgi:hypothetical protein
MSNKQRKNQLLLAFTEKGRSEAPKASQEGAESLTAKCETARPSSPEQSMEEVCERENCWQASERVQANMGSPGIDGRRPRILGWCGRGGGRPPPYADFPRSAALCRRLWMLFAAKSVADGSTDAKDVIGVKIAIVYDVVQVSFGAHEQVPPHGVADAAA